jgi:hypothetical protein
MGVGWQPQVTPLVLGLRTARTDSTGPAVLSAKTDANRGRAILLLVLPPGDGRLALRTVHAFLLPIHRELVDRIGSLNLPLPALGWVGHGG